MSWKDALLLFLSKTAYMPFCTSQADLRLGMPGHDFIPIVSHNSKFCILHHAVFSGVTSFLFAVHGSFFSWQTTSAIESALQVQCGKRQFAKYTDSFQSTFVVYLYNRSVLVTAVIHSMQYPDVYTGATSNWST